jgi:hypothetical protein
MGILALVANKRREKRGVIKKLNEKRNRINTYYKNPKERQVRAFYWNANCLSCWAVKCQQKHEPFSWWMRRHSRKDKKGMDVFEKNRKMGILVLVANKLKILT